MIFTDMNIFKAVLDVYTLKWTPQTSQITSIDRKSAKLAILMAQKFCRFASLYFFNLEKIITKLFKRADGVDDHRTTFLKHQANPNRTQLYLLSSPGAKNNTGLLIPL